MNELHHNKTPYSQGITGRFLCSVIWLITTACSSSQLASRDPVSLPPSFSSSGEAALPDRWWTTFEDAILDRLIAQALSSNFNLMSGWDRLDQAAARARRAGAALWPSLNGEAAAGYTFSNGDDFANFSLGLAASYELDLFGRIRSTRDAAAFDVLATEENLKAMAISLSAEVASTWYQLVERRAQLGLLGRQDETNRQMLDLVTIRFRSGQATAADLLQQSQLVESNRGDQIELKAQIELLQHQLAVLQGQVPGTASAPTADELIVLPPLPRTGLPAELVQRRPDVRSAFAQLHAADRRVAAAIADRFPRLSLAARGSTSAPDMRDLFSNWLVNLSANLLGPIFDGGQRKAEVALARATLQDAFHQYGQTMLIALKEVEDALTRERSAREGLDSLERQLEFSAQVIERTRDSYSKGAESFMRVLDTMLRHQALERAKISSQLNLVQYRIGLCRALAGGWPLARAERSTGE